MAIDYISYRKEICGKCEFMEIRSIGEVCGRCRCSLTFKIPIPFSQCPERKWEPVEKLDNGI